MALNLDNLKPIQSTEEARELGRKGGIKSGEARREKATMKATLEMLLNSTSKSGQTYKELATLGLIKGAMNGNSQNYKLMLELLGELTQVEIDREERQINRVEELLTKLENEAKK